MVSQPQRPETATVRRPRLRGTPPIPEARGEHRIRGGRAYTRRMRKPLMILSIVVLLGTACSSSDESQTTGAAPEQVSTTSAPTTTQPADPNTVQVSDFAFGPGELTVSLGDTVTWINVSDTFHTSSARGGEWNWELTSGGTGSEIMSEAGTFEYFCAIHGSMVGSITVEG